MLALLNGTAHAAALRAAGLAHVTCGSIQVESARERDVIVHHGEFCIVTVPDAAAGGEVPEALARAGVSVRTGGTENEVLWRKYSFLAPMALLTSWTDLPIGPALERDPAVTAGVVAEVAAVATAEGLPLEPERLTAALHQLPGAMQSSLQHDVRRGGRERARGPRREPAAAWPPSTGSRRRRSPAWWGTCASAWAEGTGSGGRQGRRG